MEGIALFFLLVGIAIVIFLISVLFFRLFFRNKESCYNSENLIRKIIWNVCEFFTCCWSETRDEVRAKAITRQDSVYIDAVRKSTAYDHQPSRNRISVIDVGDAPSIREEGDLGISPLQSTISEEFDAIKDRGVSIS